MGALKVLTYGAAYIDYQNALPRGSAASPLTATVTSRQLTNWVLASRHRLALGGPAMRNSTV
jgi:hypothetical protein